MTKNELNELLLKVNKICYGDKFRNDATREFHYLPSGLTYHIEENKNHVLEFIPCFKRYGYENIFNNGVTEMSDAYDFDLGNNKFLTDAHSVFMYNWFQRNEPDFYNKYMKHAIVY